MVSENYFYFDKNDIVEFSTYLEQDTDLLKSLIDAWDSAPLRSIILELHKKDGSKSSDIQLKTNINYTNFSKYLNKLIRMELIRKEGSKLFLQVEPRELKKYGMSRQTINFIGKFDYYIGKGDIITHGRKGRDMILNYARKQGDWFLMEDLQKHIKLGILDAPLESFVDSLVKSGHLIKKIESMHVRKLTWVKVWLKLAEK